MAHDIMARDVSTTSQESLISICQSVEEERGLIGGLKDGDRVIKLSDEITVKYGYGVTPAEAATQEFAYQNVDRSIIRVPRVFRFFEDKSDKSWPRGYLFMEYIAGTSLKDLDIDLDIHNGIIPRVATIISHLGQITGDQTPGPLGGGACRGYLWGDDGARTAFSSVSDMNRWLNRRLIIRDESIDLTPHPLVLCHMDLCRRNMILGEDNQSICLVDWAHAGLFPRFFEVATLSFLNPFDAQYQKPLLQATEELLGLTEEEKRLVKLMKIARAASMRYLFEEKGEDCGMPSDMDSWDPPVPLPS
ncbi:hypothetical protein V496_04898 [Pseudogymnoascus sp. VKM F-4515 (FW-2607)]|nr:hypothetical protein V496_04898 [Pseudogymnoascus sp. VKM F-4515 (FW-2607)]